MLGDAVLITFQLATTVCSIVVAAWVGWSVVQNHQDQRRHNELSVQPFIDVFISFIPTDFSVQVEITNNGIGPAILESVELMSREAVLVERDPIVAAANSISGRLKCLYRHQGTTFQGNYAVRPGERFLVSRINFIEGESLERAYNLLRSFVLENITCKVTYRTIYDVRGEHIGP